jgi:hypothetical protein
METPQLLEFVSLSVVGRIGRSLGDLPSSCGLFADFDLPPSTDYAAAWDEWEASGEEAGWEATAADGLADAAR